MFGLGLGECVAILVIFVLIFGPRFLVNASKRLFSSFQGFTESFKDAREEKLPPGTKVKVINPGEEASS
ncbi:twin-arginine translocase TatA/TatE family subunit [bacterium]|nr:twin-arginine translocase TatA/TatE family subunit [bacterium]